MNHKIAFIAWNAFQILQFKNLLKAMPRASLIIEKRKKSIDIPGNIFNGLDNPIITMDSTEVYQNVDGVFDILLMQTVFEQLYLFEETKIVMLQYGYAKEPHNYGTWRALADLNLAYGSYAQQRMSYFSPVEITGCPKYDGWFDAAFQTAAREKYRHVIVQNKQILLYAPSWGELSSLPLYLESLYRLADQYLILVKLHHNTIIFNQETVNFRQQYPNLVFFNEDEDLMQLIAIADLVISDYSGAIFDAIFCRKPVVLLNIDARDAEKSDHFSLEIAHRAQLGDEVVSPSQLPAVIEHALSEHRTADSALRAALFDDTDHATAKVLSCLNRLMEDAYPRSQLQSYVRATVRALEAEKQKNKKQPKGLFRLFRK